MKKLILSLAITFASISLSAQFTETSTGVFTTSNRLGINTTTLDDTEAYGYKLTIQDGDLNVGGDRNGRIKVRHIDGKSYNSTDKDNLYLNWRTGHAVVIGTHNTIGTKSDLLVSGRVRIGNDIAMPTGYQLFVKEGILTEKVKVALSTTNDWADYVFAEDYKLNSLKTVEDFVKENKHLPNIPSAKTVVENGINVAEMDAKLLRQIEELWLHTIELNKEKETLQTKYENLQNDFSALYKRVAELEQK